MIQFLYENKRFVTAVKGLYCYIPCAIAYFKYYIPSN